MLIVLGELGRFRHSTKTHAVGATSRITSLYANTATSLKEEESTASQELPEQQTLSLSQSASLGTTLLAVMTLLVLAGLPWWMLLN